MKASPETRQIHKGAATEGTAMTITMDSLHAAAIQSARRRREQLAAGAGSSCPIALRCKCLGVRQTRCGSSYVVVTGDIEPDTDDVVFQWGVSAPGLPIMQATTTTKCCDAIGEKGVVGFPVGWFKQLGQACRELAEDRYGLRHMEAIAAASAVRHYEELRFATCHKADVVLSCTIKPPIDNKPLKGKTKLEFEWKAEVGHFVEMTSTTVVVENAFRRGVSLPEGWKTQLVATALPAVAKGATEQMHARNPNLRPCCQALGVPKELILPTLGSQRTPGGSIVVRRSDGRSYEYILCACVEGALWWCHRGYTDDETQIFNNRSLELLDLDRDGGAGTPLTKKQRLQGECESKDPRALARKFPQTFSEIVAFAQWKAEELSSHTQRRSFDFSSAAAGFELHPWRWTSWEERPSHQKIWFAWSW